MALHIERQTPKQWLPYLTLARLVHEQDKSKMKKQNANEPIAANNGVLCAHCAVGWMMVSAGLYNEPKPKPYRLSHTPTLCLATI